MAFTMDAVPVMNDLVGGVRVTLTEDMPDLGKEYVKGAEIQLRGNAALRFVRTRSLEIVNANAYRMQRQQQYLAGFTEAARTVAAKNQNLAVEAFKAIELAIKKLLVAGIDVSLYNFPLCCVKKGYWTICEKSISKHKVRFLDECDNCVVKALCGGIFAGSINNVKGSIKAIK